MMVGKEGQINILEIFQLQNLCFWIRMQVSLTESLTSNFDLNGIYIPLFLPMVTFFVSAKKR